MTPRPHTPLDPVVLTAAVGLIHASATRGLTVTELAEEVGYSPFHFNRAFRASTGITPGQFLTAVRIDSAKRLLLSGRDAVIDVASEVGFDSLSSFTRRFRTVVGVTPAALRTLADHVADVPLHPFSLGDPSRPGVRIHLRLPADLWPGSEVAVWVGWFPRPVPVGLPVAGRVVTHAGDLVLPLSPGAPWLFGFAVTRNAEPAHLLIPTRPVIAAHPVPVPGPTEITLVFAEAGPVSLPLLPALPALLPLPPQQRKFGQTFDAGAA